jgi:hypothetical protein
MCRGTADERASVFWLIVQEEEHTEIAVNDKDLFPVFQDIIEMCAVMLSSWAKNP